MMYVVAHNGGTEGHSIPVLAFRDHATAVAWCNAMHESYSVAEVPIYPELPPAPWYQLKPVWPKQ